MHEKQSSIHSNELPFFKRKEEAKTMRKLSEKAFFSDTPSNPFEKPSLFQRKNSLQMNRPTLFGD